MSKNKDACKRKILVVPAAWITYEVDASDLGEFHQEGVFQGMSAPPVVVMEAMVAVGKAKRLAMIQTMNLLGRGPEDEDAGDSPFTLVDDE